jgi:iron-sulfur cluster assembly protein
MTTSATDTATPVTLTEKAAAEIKGLFEQQGFTNSALRVFVQGGGCSGYQYGMAIADEVEEGDAEFELHGVRVLIDPLSLPLLQGSSIDYVEDVMGGGFKIDNPNAVRGCGCGSSFSTEDGEAPSGGCGSGCGCG